MERNNQFDTNTVPAKKELRKQMLSLRDGLSAEDRLRGNCLITEKILGHQWFYKADILLCYVSYGSELSTLDILTEALRKGKEVYVPKVLGKGHMEFYRITSMSDLTAGFHGILEPIDGLEQFQYDLLEQNGKNCLILMPGVAFDSYKHRLGYGGGYYDRFLQDKPLLQTYSIAIGHAVQQCQQIPCEDKDINPYQILLV